MPSEFLSPGVFQMLAALLVPLFYGQWRNIYMAAIPIIAFGWTLGLSPGDRLEVAIFELYHHDMALASLANHFPVL